jgi:hypothetical protein
MLYLDCLDFIFKPCISGKLLVTTGLPKKVSAKSEVIDLDDPENVCQDLDDYPIQLSAASGGLLNSIHPLVCGGLSSTKDCHVIGQVGVQTEMLTNRYYFSSIPLNNTHLMLTGGFSITGTTIASTEIVSIQHQSMSGPDLPFALHGHCMTRINNETAILLGGNLGSNTYTSHTYLFNIGKLTWYPGPDLNLSRAYHSCGSFKSSAHGGRQVVIVAGGSTSSGQYLDSVEILDHLTGKWTEGILKSTFKNLEM